MIVSEVLIARGTGKVLGKSVVGKERKKDVEESLVKISKLELFPILWKS